MKRFLATFLALLATALLAHADGVDDQYVRIYNLIQEGDSLSTTLLKEEKERSEKRSSGGAIVSDPFVEEMERTEAAGGMAAARPANGSGNGSRNGSANVPVNIRGLDVVEGQPSLHSLIERARAF